MIAVIRPTFYIPQVVAEGLANGTLERIGGVVREVGSKKVIAWLREIPYATPLTHSSPIISLPLSPLSTISNIANVFVTQNGFHNLNNRLDKFNIRLDSIEHIVHINTAMSALTLGTAVAGFAVINQRLNDIDTRLKTLQETLNKIEQKLDLQAYARFRGALDIATKAFAMNDGQNRKALAMQAIKSLAESEHTYTNYLKEALKNEERAIYEYLLIVALIYLTETRCYLELGEYPTALKRLQEGCSKLYEFTKAYIEILLTSNPAAYITPFLKEEISLTRLSRIYRWLDPALQETDVFEKVRINLFQWHVDASVLSGFSWLKDLTPAILTKAEFEKRGYFSRSEQVEQVLACLPRYMEIMESAIETYNRLEGYQAEVEGMQDQGLSFQEWLSFRPAEEPPKDAQMMCIMAA